MTRGADRTPVLSVVGPTIRIPALGLDGWIDAVELHGGAPDPHRTSLEPPAVVRPDRPTTIRLDGPVPATASAVGIAYREREPGGGSGPPKRRSFTTLQRIDKEIPMTDGPDTQPLPSSGSRAPARHQRQSRHRFVTSTVDFGTTRSVGVVRDLNKRPAGFGRSLSAEATRRAGEVLGERPSPSGLGIDFKTAHLPSRRMDAWEAAFSAPPLARERLEVVTEFSSDLVVLADGTFDFRSERPHGADAIVVRGVKRYLSFPGHRLADVDRDADEVLAAAVDGLARYTSRGLTEDGKDDPTFGRLHLTYPTKLPADRRDVLADGVRSYGHDVVIEVDEAAGAAGFWVMCRFGEDYDLGVEAFKATARCHSGARAWEDPEAWRTSRSWHENWLIVDVGGGTTDCAAVRLGVLDVTPADIPADKGRYHQIQPQITASGGIINLGGDEITKRLFVSLKKLIGLTSETWFDRVSADVRAIRLANFDRLWNAAERVKHLAYGQVDVTPVRVVVGPSSDSDLDPDGQGAVVHIEGFEDARSIATDVEISAEDLEAIARPVLDRLAALAAGIGQAGSETRGGESIDRVAFSGGSMLATYLRTQLEARLRRAFADDEIGDAFIADFDPTFCKTGTALGAMFFNAFYDFSAEPGESKEELLAGMRLVGVDISKMHANVAADFFLHRVGSSQLDGDLIFPRGQRLAEDDDGIRRARSGPQSPRRLLRVLRQDFDGELISVDDEAADDGDDGGIGSRPWASAEDLVDGDLAAFIRDNDLSMRFEIDELERIHLLLTKGVDDPALDLGHGEPIEVDEGRVLVADGSLQLSLADGLGTPGVAGGSPVVRLLFPAGQEVGVGLVAEVRDGLVWARGEGDDEYGSFVTMPVGRPWLSIDGAGQVRCHERRPPELRVAEIGELIAAPPGATFRTLMTTEAAYHADDDPFSGML